jgi:hypothetical protein
MHHELSVVLPQVRRMRHDLADLRQMAQAPLAAASLHRRRDRLQEMRDLIGSMKRISQAAPDAFVLADQGLFEEAFGLLDDTAKLLSGRLLSVRALQHFVPALKEARAEIAKRAKVAFFGLFVNEAPGPAGLVRVLAKYQFLEEAASEAIDVVGRFAIESVQRVFNDSADQKGFKVQNLSDLSVQNFTQVLTQAFGAIRTRFVVKGNEAISRIMGEFGELGLDQAPLRRIQQSIADKVIKEATTIASAHHLRGATLDNFADIFEILLSFGSAFEAFNVDKTLLQASVVTLSRSFLESFHSEQFACLRAALAAERWAKAEPAQEHIDILRKLTVAEVAGFAIVSDNYGPTNTSLVLLALTWQYVQAVRKIPKASDDIMLKYIETVKFFATQTYEIIMRKGGKTVPLTTKNLALAAAGLDFFRRLIPYLTSRLLAMRGTKDTLSQQFNELAKGLETHCQNLLDNVPDVIAKNIAASLKAPGFEPGKVSTYASAITKDILNLHSGISDCLPQSILTPIFAKIGATLSEAVTQLMKANAQRFEGNINRDIEFFNTQLQVCPCTVQLNFYRS